MLKRYKYIINYINVGYVIINILSDKVVDMQYIQEMSCTGFYFVTLVKHYTQYEMIIYLESPKFHTQNRTVYSPLVLGVMLFCITALLTSLSLTVFEPLLWHEFVNYFNWQRKKKRCELAKFCLWYWTAYLGPSTKYSEHVHTEYNCLCDIA